MNETQTDYFETLYEEYRSIIKKMQDYLLEMNNGKSEIDVYGKTCLIKGNANPADLRTIYSSMKQKVKSDKRYDENVERANHLLSKNKFNPQHPYGIGI